MLTYSGDAPIAPMAAPPAELLEAEPKALPLENAVTPVDLGATIVEGAVPPRSGGEVTASPFVQRPVSVAVIPEGIPADLKSVKRWVCWQYERAGAKWKKPPVCPGTGQKASVNNPSTWDTFSAAYNHYLA